MRQGRGRSLLIVFLTLVAVTMGLYASGPKYVYVNGYCGAAHYPCDRGHRVAALERVWYPVVGD